MSHSNHYQIHHSQNFLVNTRLIEHLVTLAGIDKHDTVVEIGPGTGAITRVLAKVAGHVLAIEQDQYLTQQLVDDGNLPGNVTVISADVLEVQMPSSQYRVFANIPFRHTAAIVGKLTTGNAPPLDAWLVVQKEAAHRFLISDRSTMLAISLAPWFETSIQHQFSRRDFSPRPNVDSVMLRLESRSNPLLPLAERVRYRRMVDVLFGAWTPTLREAVKARLPRKAGQHVLKNTGIDWHAKPSNVAVEHWVLLYRELVFLDDDRIWSDLDRYASKHEKERSNLQRPTRTKVNHRKSR